MLTFRKGSGLVHRLLTALLFTVILAPFLLLEDKSMAVGIAAIGTFLITAVIKFKQPNHSIEVNDPDAKLQTVSSSDGLAMAMTIIEATILSLIVLKEVDFEYGYIIVVGVLELLVIWYTNSLLKKIK